MRTASVLLPYLPAEAIVYGTIPNPGITIGRAVALADEQSAQNATFGAWWNSETGQMLRQMVDRVQSVNPLLGEEIAFCASIVPGLGDPVPMVMARVKPGKQAELSSALAETLRRGGRGCGNVFGFERPRGRFRIAFGPGVGPRSPGAAAPGLRLRQPSESGTGAAWAG